MVLVYDYRLGKLGNGREMGLWRAQRRARELTDLVPSMAAWLFGSPFGWGDKTGAQLARALAWHVARLEGR